MNAERATLEGDLAKTDGERAGVASGVSPQALALFERVSKHRHGVAMSEARDGLCSACHVRLRPQVYNDVRRNAGLMQCESCSRILYFTPVTPSAVNVPPAASAEG